MPLPNCHGNIRYWTKEAVIAGLKKAAKEIRGPLPCLDRSYSEIKKGHYDWPTATRILDYFHSIARGWLAAGVSKHRVSLRNIEWLPEETEYLLTHAGTKKLEDIARHLNRSYPSVRKELQKYGTRARDSEGYVSASQLAKEIPCSYNRLLEFLNAGLIKGAHFDKIRNRWKIDPFSIDPVLENQLKSPRKTHNTWPLDLGDYRQRYNIKRGKT